MKNNYILSGLFIAACLLIANTSRVNSEADQPPPVSVGDAFVSNTCARAGCHESFPLQTAPASYINLGIGTGQPTTPLNSSFQYTENTDYNIAFTLTPQANVYGFGLSALNAGGQQAGSFTLTNTNTTTSAVTAGRTYIGHKNANTIKNWGFKWTAPAASTGAVTFSYAFNLGNGDGTRFTDSIFKGSVTILPLGTGVNDISTKISSLEIFPNPVTSEFSLSFTMKQSDNVFVQIYSLDGKISKDLLNDKLQQGEFNQSFNINDLSAGIYLVRLKVGDAFVTQKLIKQ